MDLEKDRMAAVCTLLWNTLGIDANILMMWFLRQSGGLVSGDNGCKQSTKPGG